MQYLSPRNGFRGYATKEERERKDYAPNQILGGYGKYGAHTGSGLIRRTIGKNLSRFFGGGKFKICEEAACSYTLGGLSVLIELFAPIGLVEQLDEQQPYCAKSPTHYHPEQILVGFMLSVIAVAEKTIDYAEAKAAYFKALRAEVYRRGARYLVAESVLRRAGLILFVCNRLRLVQITLYISLLHNRYKCRHSLKKLPQLQQMFLFHPWIPKC